MELMLKYTLEYIFLHTLCMPLVVQRILEDITKKDVSYTLNDGMVIFTIKDVITITFITNKENYIKEILYV